MQPATPIDRVRLMLAMRDADYDASPEAEDVAALLRAYDEARHDVIRLHKEKLRATLREMAMHALKE